MLRFETELGRYLDDSFLYSIYNTDVEELNIIFIDFKYQESEPDDEYQTVIGPDVFKKSLKLKTVDVEIKNDDIEESLKNYLNVEFTNIIKELGEKSRSSKNTSLNLSSDIDINKWREETPLIIGDNLALIRRIIAKFNNCSNYIATSGRIGPAQFIITNDIINKYLYDLTGDLMFLNRLKYFVCKNLDNSEIVLGRKNEIDQPGVCLIVKETSLNELYENDNKKYIKLKYNFSINGFMPESQYFLIKNNFLDYAKIKEQ